MVVEEEVVKIEVDCEGGRRMRRWMCEGDG